MKIVFLSFLTYFIVSSSYAAQESRSLVILFGDSITVGFNSGRRVDFGNGSTTLSGPTRFLSDILNNDDEPRPTTVVNWGVGGSSSSLGVQLLSATVVLTRGTHSHDNCFVLVMYGTNDFGRGISSTTTMFNNREMIRQTRAEGCTPIIGNLTPRSDRDLAPLSSGITAIAASENAIVVDQFGSLSQQPLDVFFELETSLLTGGLIRLHPNDSGYLRIARNWFNQALRGLIAPLESQATITPIINFILDEED